MNRRQRLIVIVLNWVPVLALAAWSAIFLAGQFQKLASNVALIWEQELAQRLGREVHVGRADVSRPGLAILEDVDVANAGLLRAGSVISAARVEVHYSLADLILGKRARAVTLVKAFRPRLNLVRRKDGSYNVLELLKALRGPPGPAFVGKVRVVDGAIEFRDFLAHTAKVPALTRAAHIMAR